MKLWCVVIVAMMQGVGRGGLWLVHLAKKQSKFGKEKARKN